MINNNSIVVTPTKSSSSTLPSSTLSPSNNALTYSTPNSTSTPPPSSTPSPSSASRMTTIVSSAPIIKKLPKHLQDTLKSGTSISNLSDCVKELIENAIDAQATNIEITLCGDESLTIKDNGHGIHPDNFETLCKRYYTHKFTHFNQQSSSTINSTSTTNSTTDDDHSNVNNTSNEGTLDSSSGGGGDIIYYGYKGEALNSICNLSKQVHIKTKHEDDSSNTTSGGSSELGTYLIYDKSGEIVSKTLVRMNKGTIITINELFSTIPVRRKCFKMNLTNQVQDLIQMLKQLTLIHFNIRFSFKNSSNSTSMDSTNIGSSNNLKNSSFIKNSNIKNLKQSLNTIFGIPNLYDHLYMYNNLNLDENTIFSNEPINGEYSLQIHVPNYETIIKSNQLLDSTPSTNEREINKFLHSTKPLIFINQRLISKFDEIQKAVKEIFSNFFKSSSRGGNIFYLLILKMKNQHFSMALNKSKLISNLNDKIKKELQVNLVKYYAEENNRLNGGNGINSGGGNGSVMLDDDVIDNNLNNSFNLKPKLPSKYGISNHNNNNSSTLNNSNISMLSTSSTNSGGVGGIGIGDSPSNLSAIHSTPKHSISYSSPSSNNSSPPFRTPPGSTTNSNQSTPQSLKSFSSSSTTTTPSTPQSFNNNRRSLIINQHGSGGSSSSYGHRSGSTSSHVYSSGGGGNASRGVRNNDDDSLLLNSDTMDDLIGVPILPKNHQQVDNQEDNSDRNDDNSNIRNDNSNSIDKTNQRIVAPTTIDINKFKSKLTTPNNSKKRKTIQTKLTLDNTFNYNGNNNSQLLRNIEIENINEELIFKKRKLYSSNPKSSLNFNSLNEKISKNDIFTNIEIIGELENKIGIIYHKIHHQIYYLNLNLIKSDIIFNNLMNNYSFKESIIPLSQPINLLLCKNELSSNKNLKSICVRSEYQSIFEMNGFKIEFEKQPIENEPKRKKIVKLNLIGIINATNSFGSSGGGGSAGGVVSNYGLQDFIELLKKIEHFEQDLLEQELIKKLLQQQEKKVSKMELIVATAMQFRPNTMIEYFKNTAKLTASSLLNRRHQKQQHNMSGANSSNAETTNAAGNSNIVHEILVELKNSCFFKLHELMSRVQSDENFNDLLNDITDYFHPMDIGNNNDNSSSSAAVGGDNAGGSGDNAMNDELASIEHMI